MKNERLISLALACSALEVGACAADVTATSDDENAVRVEALDKGNHGGRDAEFSVFTFQSKASTSEQFKDGDVRLDAVVYNNRTLTPKKLETVKRAKILVDDGVDATRGGHNYASGQGINSAKDSWTSEGPATITPTSQDLKASLANFNLTSIVVTRENVGTAGLEVSFERPVNTFFFWERGAATSPTTANSDLLVEALDDRGRVIAAHKLLRSEYAPTGIVVTTWNGSFSSPSTPDGVPPQLGAAGLSLDKPVQRLRLTSVQEGDGGINDDGPDYKVLAANIEDDHSDHGHR